MVIRMLGPAAPIGQSRSASVRASLRLPPGSRIRTTWEWDDGQVEREEHDWAVLVHARGVHRYASTGVYRVQLRVGGARGEDCDEATRYVVVAEPDQLAASGWIRVPSGRAVPFGFLITPTLGSRAGQVELRCLLDGGELVGRHLAWLLASEAGTLHFGGDATVAGDDGHPYRVDASLVAAGDTAARQQLTLSVYAPGGVPGRDAPVERISGLIRPGRVEMVASVARR